MLEQSWQTFSVKGKAMNILDFPVTSYPLQLLNSAIVLGKQPQVVSEQTGVVFQ